MTFAPRPRAPAETPSPEPATTSRSGTRATLDRATRVHHLDARCCFASREDVTLSLWYGPPTPDRVVMQRSLIESVLDEHPSVLALTVFRTRGVSPAMATMAVADRGVWAAFDSIVQLLDGRLLAHAVLVQEGGFASAMVRSLVTSLLIRLQIPARAGEFARRDASLDWLLDQRPGGARPGEREAIERVLDAISGSMDEPRRQG